MPRRSRFLFLLFGVTILAGCAPSISPLYRDYDVEPAAGADPATERSTPSGDEAAIRERLRAALAEAGWTEADPAAPNVISTAPREVSNWGLYRVLVSLDVVPIGDRHVRVQVHPVRHSITGGRSKIPYLGSGLRQALLPALNEALEARGFYSLDTPRERDEEHVAAGT